MKMPEFSEEALEIAKMYTLLSIGVSYQDLIIMPATTADALLMLHTHIKEKEKKDLKGMDKSQW